MAIKYYTVLKNKNSKIKSNKVSTTYFGAIALFLSKDENIDDWQLYKNKGYCVYEVEKNIFYNKI